VLYSARKMRKNSLGLCCWVLWREINKEEGDQEGHKVRRSLNYLGVRVCVCEEDENFLSY